MKVLKLKKLSCFLLSMTIVLSWFSCAQSSVQSIQDLPVEILAKILNYNKFSKKTLRVSKPFYKASTGFKVTDTGLEKKPTHTINCSNIDLAYGKIYNIKENKMISPVIWYCALKRVSNYFFPHIRNYLPFIKASNINTLTFTKKSVTPEDLESLVTNLPHTHITDLDISSNDLGDKALCLAAILHKTRITSLDLSLNNLGNAVAETLSKTLPQSNIISLDLFYNRISGRGFLWIVEGCQHATVESLFLGSNKITDKGMGQVARALKHTNLKRIEIQCNQISQKGMSRFKVNIPKSIRKNIDCQFFWRKVLE